MGKATSPGDTVPCMAGSQLDEKVDQPKSAEGIDHWQRVQAECTHRRACTCGARYGPYAGCRACTRCAPAGWWPAASWPRA
eukprot:COSAG01_NODE_552_length_15569_cov_37.676123_14_plen_81_part_00